VEDVRGDAKIPEGLEPRQTAENQPIRPKKNEAIGVSIFEWRIHRG
jgi:hypothetical protein